MKINLNDNFSLIKESYLFSEIGRKVREYSAVAAPCLAVARISAKSLMCAPLQKTPVRPGRANGRRNQITSR